LQNLEGLTFPEAMRNVIGEDYNHTQNIQQYKTFTPQAEPEKPKEFQMPEKNSDHKGMYAYLAQTRKISPFVINEFIKQNLIYQEKATRNAVFLHTDDSGKTVGAELRGTSSDPTKKFAKNVGEKSGFRYTKGTPDKAIFFESAIDLMSYLSLEERGNVKVDNAVYVSMAGLTASIIKPFADKGLSICLCVDNDEAGDNFTKRLIDDGVKIFASSALKDFSKTAETPVKDFNELLKKIVEIETEQKSKSHEKSNEQHLSQIKNIAQNNYSQKKFPQRNEANSQKNEKV
jgi:ribosomal protein L11